MLARDKYSVGYDVSSLGLMSPYPTPRNAEYTRILEIEVVIRVARREREIHKGIDHGKSPEIRVVCRVRR